MILKRYFLTLNQKYQSKLDDWLTKRLGLDAHSGYGSDMEDLLGYNVYETLHKKLKEMGYR